MDGTENNRGGTHERDANESPVVDFGDSRPREYTALEYPTLTVPERIALGTHKLRVVVAVVILIVFGIMNGLVLLGINRALNFDFAMLLAKTVGYERFINTAVITSILGATTVQLGAIMFAITKFLFPNR